MLHTPGNTPNLPITLKTRCVQSSNPGEPVKLKRVSIHLGDKEWSSDEGHQLMPRLAKEAIEANSEPDTLTIATVYEHGGWWLTYAKNAAGDIMGVGSANDLAVYRGEAEAVRQKIRNATSVSGIEIRR